MILPLIAAVSIAAAPTPPWKLGDFILTGADFSAACNNRADETRELACVYFFRGVTAMAAMAKTAEYDRYGIAPAQRLGLFCSPSTATTYDLISVIARAVAKSPVLQTQAAPKVIAQTLAATYPCASPK